MDDEISYAISIGEGTLLAYGTGDIEDLFGPEIGQEIEAHKDSFYIAFGPADGTGQ